MTSLALKLSPRAVSVHCTEDELVVALVDGRVLSVPLLWFPRLASASPLQRADYELLGDGDGIHWKILDEDVSVAGLLRGQPAVESAAARG